MSPLVLLALSSPIAAPQMATPKAPLAWPLALSASVRHPIRPALARKALVARAKAPTFPPSARPASVKATSTLGLPPGIESVTSDMAPETGPPPPGTLGSREWVDALHALEGGLAPGRALAAAGKAERFLDDNPGARASIGYRLADLDVALGWWSDAYRLMAPLATEQADPATLLRCSVVAAAYGQVYAGQRAYLVRSILAGSSSSTRDRREYLPQGDAPADVLTLSMLATACEADSHHDEEVVRLYGGMVLKRDPGNPLVCWQLSNYAMAESRFAEAVAYLNQGRARTSGDWVSAFQSRLVANRRLLAQQTAARVKDASANKGAKAP